MMTYPVLRTPIATLHAWCRHTVGERLSAAVGAVPGCGWCALGGRLGVAAVPRGDVHPGAGQCCGDSGADSARAARHDRYSLTVSRGVG